MKLQPYGGAEMCVLLLLYRQKLCSKHLLRSMCVTQTDQMLQIFAYCR